MKIIILHNKNEILHNKPKFIFTIKIFINDILQNKVSREQRARITVRRDDEQRQHYYIYTSEHALDFPSDSQYLVVSDEPSVPLSIFSTRLSALQALVRFLYEERNYSFAQVGELLNRSQKTVWATYQAAKSQPFVYAEGELTIPIARFASRILSPLETLVVFLTELGFSNAETARFLSLDPRTTWTVKQRAKKKEVRS